MYYEIMLLLIAVGTGVGFAAAWRLGLRDGMRAAKQQEPAPLLPVVRTSRAAEDADEELQETLESIDRFDGWKR